MLTVALKIQDLNCKQVKFARIRCKHVEFRTYTVQNAKSVASAADERFSRVAMAVMHTTHMKTDGANLPPEY